MNTNEARDAVARPSRIERVTWIALVWLAMMAYLPSTVFADEDCITSSKIVVVKQSGGSNKGDNSSPLTGTGNPPPAGPFIYVSELNANEAICHDPVLDPFDTIDGPGSPDASYSGFAIAGFLPTVTFNWYDQTSSIFYRTTPAGGLLLSAPVPPMGPIRGMCFDPVRNSFWLCQSGLRRFIELSPAGVPTGVFFDSPGGPSGSASGISFCHDTGHLMVGYGDGPTITTLARVFYDGETWGVGIDVTDLNLAEIGFTHVTSGSNGTPSIYIVDQIANLNIEIDAPQEVDCNGNGISDACEVRFIRGDCNDDFDRDLADVVRVLLYLFAGASVPCEAACDANDNGGVQIDDAIALISFLFMPGTPPLPAPFDECGVDCTPDVLTCAVFASCP